MCEYLPINPSSLRADTKIGCDLYLLVNAALANRYVLYSRGDGVFENSKREMLLEKNISRLFIKRDDQQK